MNPALAITRSWGKCLEANFLVAVRTSWGGRRRSGSQRTSMEAVMQFGAVRQSDEPLQQMSSSRAERRFLAMKPEIAIRGAWCWRCFGWVAIEQGGANHTAPVPQALSRGIAEGGRGRDAGERGLRKSRRGEAAGTCSSDYATEESRRTSPSRRQECTHECSDQPAQLLAQSRQPHARPHLRQLISSLVNRHSPRKHRAGVGCISGRLCN